MTAQMLFFDVFSVKDTHLNAFEPLQSLDRASEQNSFLWGKWMKDTEISVFAAPSPKAKESGRKWK